MRQEMDHREALIELERRLIFPAFDNLTAIALGQQMVQSAQRQGLALVINITRCQQIMFHAALPGTCADSDGWVRRKAATVYRFGHSTLLVAATLRQDNEHLVHDYGLSPADFTVSGGGFPILLKGLGVIGTAAASGLAETVDHEFVVQEIARFLAVAI
jgi:uncharacterized protein (UPF0303 family)